MATAAVEWLGEHRADPVGGVIVAPRQVPAPHPRLGDDRR